MTQIITDIIEKLNDINNPTFNMQKDGVKTLLEMIISSGNLNIILEEELRNALSPVLLYVKLVENIDSHDDVFEIFARAYSETLTNLNYFINYDIKKRDIYLSQIHKGAKCQ